MTLSGSWDARGKELSEGEEVDCGGRRDWLSLTERSGLSLVAMVLSLVVAQLGDFGGIWCGGEEEHTAGDNESLSIELFWWLEFGRWLGNWGAGGDWVDKASIGLGSSGELEKNVKFTFEVTWPSREGLPLPRGFLVFGSSWIKDGLIFKVREIWRYNEMFDFMFYF